jgi:hypothetical protein
LDLSDLSCVAARRKPGGHLRVTDGIRTRDFLDHNQVL